MSKMRSQSMKISFFLFHFIGANLAFANLPDEIDILTYQKDYDQKLQVSNRDRSHANDLLDQLEEIKKEIKKTEELILSMNDEVADQKQSITATEDDIRQRYSDIEHYENENIRLHHENRRLNSEIIQLEQDISNTRGYLVQEENILRDIAFKLQKVRERFSRVRKLFRNQKEKTKRLSDELAHNQNLTQNLIQERNDVKAKIENFQEKIPLLEQKIKELVSQSVAVSSRIDDLKRKRNNLQTQLREIEGKKRNIKGKLDSAKEELRPLTDNINRTKAEISQLTSKKSELTRQISAKESKLQRLQSRLQNLPSNIRTLKSEIANLERKRPQIQTALNQLKQKKTRLENRVANLQNRVREYRSGTVTPEIREKIKKLMAQIRSLKGQIKEVDRQIGVKEKELQDTNAKITRKKSSLEKLQNQEGSLRQNITNLKTSIAQNKRELGSVNSKLTSLNQKLNGLERQYSQRSGKVKKLQEQLNAIVASYNSKESEVSAVSNQITAQEGRLSKVMNNIDQKKAQLASMKNKLPSLRNRLTTINNRIRDLRNENAVIKRELADSREVLRDLREKRDRIKNRLENIRLKLSEQRQVVEQIENNLNILLHERESRVTLLSNNVATIKVNESQIQSHTEAIAQNRENIDYYKNRIKELEVALADSKVYLESLNRQLEGEISSYEVADRSARESEKITAEALLQLNRRQALYQKYMRKAKELGSGQALAIASSEGLEKGLILAREAGKYNGEKIGFELALLDGELRGLVRGELSGYDTGYNDGVNSEVDFRRGFNEGLLLGKNKAEAEALETHFPKGFVKQRNFLLTQFPKETIEIDNRNKNFKSQNKLVESLKEMLDIDETVITDLEWDRSDRLQTVLDTSISRLKNKISSYDHPDRNLSSPELSYVEPKVITIDFKDQDCSLVYKGVEDFKLACIKSYKNSFKAQFLDSHKSNFIEHYPENYNSGRKNKFSVHKNDRFSAGKNRGYPLVYSEAKILGSKVAHQKGIEEGAVKGYASHIEQARDMAYTNGKENAQNYFRENSVVRIDSRNSKKAYLNPLHEDGLIQGSSFNISVLLTNFGHEMQKRGDSILRFEVLSGNIKLEKASTLIADLNGRKNFVVNEVVKGQVLNDAIPGSEIEIKLTFVTKGDDYQNEVRESFIIKDRVVVNPELNVTLEYDEEPKWRKWVVWPSKWKFRKQKVKVTLKGIRDNIPGSYTVQLEAVNGMEYYDVTKTDIETGAIKKDQELTVELKYKFKKKAKKKDLAFNVFVKYGEKIVYEEKLILKTEK